MTPESFLKTGDILVFFILISNLKRKPVSVKNLVFRDIFNEIMFGFLVRNGIWSVKKWFAYHDQDLTNFV